MKRWKIRLALSAPAVAVLSLIPLAQADATIPSPAPTECGHDAIVVAGQTVVASPGRTTGLVSGPVNTTVEQPLWDLRATPGVSDVVSSVHDVNCYVVVGVLKL
jgi:hypothetical protein